MKSGENGLKRSQKYMKKYSDNSSLLKLFHVGQFYIRIHIGMTGSVRI